MTISVIQDDDKLSYDIYDRFTVEHFPLRQSMILTTSFFCSRQYILLYRSAQYIFFLKK
jgi:hypothetical protein